MTSLQISLEAAQVLRRGPDRPRRRQDRQRLRANHDPDFHGGGDEFSFPYLEELIRHLHGLGAKVLLHICNDTTRLLERMVKIGADILSLDVQVDLGRAKQVAGTRAARLGECRHPEPGDGRSRRHLRRDLPLHRARRSGRAFHAQFLLRGADRDPRREHRRHGTGGARVRRRVPAARAG